MSERGKLILILNNNFKFCKDYTSKESTNLWRYIKKLCSAKVYTHKKSKILCKSECTVLRHNHIVENNITRQEVSEVCKKKASLQKLSIQNFPHLIWKIN